MAVRCVPWCRGAWCCLPSVLTMLHPSLALPRGVVLALACGCAPFLACIPHSAAGYPPSSFFVAALFTLSSTLCCSVLLPDVHFHLPHLRPCVWLRFFLRLLPRSLGPPPCVLLGPVRERKDGGGGHCEGGGIDDDIGECTSLAMVGVYVAAAAMSPNVVCVCVAVSWFFSIPLVRRWRPMRVWLGMECLVTRRSCTLLLPRLLLLVAFVAFDCGHWAYL